MMRQYTASILSKNSTIYLFESIKVSINSFYVKT